MTTTSSNDSPVAAGATPVLPPGDDRRFLHWNRRFAHWARWLHTYLSMISFAILLFFAVTGLTLNHADWFTAGRQTTLRYKGTLDTAWLKSSDPKVLDIAPIADYFRRSYGVRTGESDYQADESQCEVSFKGPGYEADAVIDRDTGNYDLTVSRFGLVAVLNDLHKGRDTGGKWSLLIDIAAVFMSLVALTGLTLIFYLTKRRASGLLLFACGLLVCYLVYAFWVP